MQGFEAENIALQLLQKQGLKLLAQNWYAKGGELDLVMLEELSSKQETTLIFVEVRYRKQAKYGSAAESVNMRKQQRIITAATQFLAKNPIWDNYACRFDVVAFDGKYNPRWIKAAFEI